MGALNIYCFYHGLALYVDILPLAIARGKIFGMKGPTIGKISIYSRSHELILNYSMKRKTKQQYYNVEAVS